MGYAERNVWTGTIASIACVIVYLAIILSSAATMPIADVAWQWPMIWCIVAGLAVAIVASIVWGLIASARDRETEHRADIRDRDIERMGDRIGQAFLTIGGVGALILTMLGADLFWIGNAIFFGFFLSATVGGIAQLIAYRRGLV